MLLGTLLLLFVVTLSIYRKWRAEQEIEGLLWKLDPEELEVTNVKFFTALWSNTGFHHV